MFGIDGPEFLVILLVLIVVVGPKDLPKMLKTIAKAIAYIRSAANEFRHQFDDAMRQIELDDLQKTLSDISDLNLSKELTETSDPMPDVPDVIVGGIDGNFDINATHHKSKQDKAALECDQKTANEDLTTSVNFHSSENISGTSKNTAKNKKGVS
ncbi:Sec-independent protein translocase protein TatB [Bartonella machadoae]|uniref:Sec-independent protein translocase protein TatB n=1 Tax=Bartonella machadoae TaxID=2893471 RepID=UPI001F4CD9E8|nr:Sec-independent protein translocase protein TatB [Bartonella machadoae]UNE53474.1 Sec-independent protein translocase protein TatB [Bartonella machadoae]